MKMWLPLGLSRHSGGGPGRHFHGQSRLRGIKFGSEISNESPGETVGVGQSYCLEKLIRLVGRLEGLHDARRIAGLVALP